LQRIKAEIGNTPDLVDHGKPARYRELTEGAGSGLEKTLFLSEEGKGESPNQNPAL
jgi:hypothetical protein